MLAAYTPSDLDVAIVDEAFETIDFDMDADLVAITFVVPLALRAYEVAGKFSERGKTVVCGGPHASLMPFEAADYFDAVVIGEGDLIWPQLLKDFKNGKLKKIYRSTSIVDPAKIPFPRIDLLKAKRYSILNAVQATRGCPFSCKFCTTRTIYPTFTTRPVKSVVKEIEQAEGGLFRRRVILFWDDNLIGNPVWAKKLFQEIAPLNKIWFGQCTFNIAENKELVRLAYKSGCRGLFFGLESFNQVSLKNCDKQHNIVKTYKNGIQFLHDSGISVYAGVMMGFDDDNKDIFRITLEQTTELAIDMVAPRIVVPYPNTSFFMKLYHENRIIHTNWSKYDGSHAVFKPKHMTAVELENGFNWFNRKFHAYGSIAERLWKSKTFPWLMLPINLSKHNAIKKVPRVKDHSAHAYSATTAFTEDF